MAALPEITLNRNNQTAVCMHLTRKPVKRLNIGVRWADLEVLK